MIINNIKSQNSFVAQANNTLFNKGNIFTATITKEDKNSFYLQSQKTSFAVSKNYLEKAKIGESFDFKVRSNEKGKVELEKIDLKNTFSSEDLINGELRESKVLEMFKSHKLLKEYDSIEDMYKPDETEEMAKDVINKISAQLKSASGNLSATAISELINSGVDLTKISLNILNSVMSEIETRPIKEIDPTEIEGIIQNKLKENNLDSSSLNNLEKIISELDKNGLNLSEENINEIQKSIDKFNEIKENQAIFYDENANATLNNLYKLSFEGVNEYRGDFEKSKDLYREFAEKNNFEYDANFEKIIKSLLDKDIDINNTNLQNIIDTQKQIDQMNINGAIEKAASSLKTNGTTDFNIFEKIQVISKTEIFKNNENLKENLSKIQNINLENFINNNKPLILGELTNTSNKQIDERNYQTINNDVLLARKNLLEIQLKLTYETQNSLAHKGIDLNTKTIENAIKEINTVIDESFAKKISSLNLENSEDVSKMSKIYSEVKQDNQLFNSTYSGLIKDEISFNISSINTSQLDKMLKGYESFETIPKSSMGENFNSVRGQITNILESLNLPVNQKNIRAVEILSRSNTEVNLENILEIKNIDLKLEKIQTEFSPKMIVELFQNGYNPLEMNVDEIISFIDEFKEKKGISNDENLINNLISMSKDKNTDDDVMDGIKGIYRVLNILDKGSYRSIGSILDSENNLTLENLLNSEKYLRNINNQYSWTFSENIGYEYTEFKFNKSSISQIIENAVSKSYNHSLIDKLKDNINYDDLKNYLKENIDTSIEDLDFSNSEMIKKYNELLNNLKDVTNSDISNMLNSKLEYNLENLLLLSNNRDNSFRNRFKDLNKDKEIDFKELNHEDIESLTGTGNLIDIAIGDIKATDYELEDIPLRQRVLKELDIFNSLNKNENENYYTPIKLPFSNENTFLYVYELNESLPNSNESTIGFSIDTENLGNIKGYIKVSLEDVSINFDVENVGKEKLNINSKNLVKALEVLGYKNPQVQFKE